MDITGILSLLGGLALFLYGMQMMSNGLEAAAGNKMKKILEKLTANRVLGIAVGAGITAVIQSSSATTVMVVGFVNSGMMRLEQAVWIIMGANIGTTITGQLIALDVGAIAPLFAFLGVAMVVFLKNPKIHHFGMIIAGLGILFIGMDMMSSAMMPLRDSEAFVSLMTKFSNPLLGILAGAVFTALIQSSSASVGILQALATSGAINFSSAVYVLFGQNIGTCITAVLASIGTSRNAKRTTIIHLTFNIIGTVVFTTVCVLFPLANVIENLTPGNPAAQIANMHTLFNIVTTIILLPFGGMLATFAEKLLPSGKEQGGEAEEMALQYLKPIQSGKVRLGATAIHLDQLRQEISRMLGMARKNVETGFDAILSGDLKLMEEEKKREEYIDFLNKEISQYISKTFTRERNARNFEAVEEYFLITGNVERIGDHADNICGYVKVAKDHKVQFSEEAVEEIQKMKALSLKALDSLSATETGTPEWLSEIAAMEQKMDDMTERYRRRHLERMKDGLCSEEACILYSEMLTDFERIGDHILNIAQADVKIPRENY